MVIMAVNEVINVTTIELSCVMKRTRSWITKVNERIRVQFCSVGLRHVPGACNRQNRVVRAWT